MLFDHLKNSLRAKFKRTPQLYSTKEEYYEGRIRLPLISTWLGEKHPAAIPFKPVLLVSEETDFTTLSLSTAKKKLPVTYRKSIKTALDELQVLFVKTEILGQKCIVQAQFEKEAPVYLSYEISGFSKTEPSSSNALPEALQLFVQERDAAFIGHELTLDQESIFFATYDNWLMVVQYEFKLMVHFINRSESYARLLDQAAEALLLSR
jgi:hypothetical protein